MKLFTDIIVDDNVISIKGKSNDSFERRRNIVRVVIEEDSGRNLMSFGLESSKRPNFI